MGLVAIYHAKGNYNFQGCWHFFMLSLTRRGLFPWCAYDIWWAGRKESSEGFRILRITPGSGTWAPFGGVLSIVAMQRPRVCVLIFPPGKPAHLRFYLHSLFGHCFSCLCVGGCCKLCIFFLFFLFFLMLTLPGPDPSKVYVLLLKWKTVRSVLVPGSWGNCFYSLGASLRELFLLHRYTLNLLWRALLS